jgi:hypothetical protein
MGKGLDLKPSGVHVAFTAGTGILPFLDIVAYLIRYNLNDAEGNPNGSPEESMNERKDSNVSDDLNQ